MSWFERALNDPDYNVEDDYEEFHKERTCSRCGTTFTLDEAFSDYENYFNGDLTYNGCGYDGDLCGICAAKREDRKYK